MAQTMSSVTENSYSLSYYQEIMTKWIYLPIPCSRSLEHASQSSLKLSIKPNMGNINLICERVPKVLQITKRIKTNRVIDVSPLLDHLKWSTSH